MATDLLPAHVHSVDALSARRGTISERERVLRFVKWILSKLTLEKFELQQDQVLHAGINSADILQGVTSLIFDMAVLKPTLSPLYSELCVSLDNFLPKFPSDEPDGKPITFRCILLHICQEEFEGDHAMRAEICQLRKPEQKPERQERERLVKLRTLGHTRLVEELLKQNMIPETIVRDCMQGVTQLIFDKAVLEPTFCPVYTELYLRLGNALPEFPSDKPDGKCIKFLRILLNMCQQVFEGSDALQMQIQQLMKPEQELEQQEKRRLLKLKSLGTIRVIGILFKQKILPARIVHHVIKKVLSSDDRGPSAEMNVEAVCELLTIVGKQFRDCLGSKRAIELYFARLKDLSDSPHFSSRVKVLVRNTVEMQQTDEHGIVWGLQQERVKGKTSNELFAEAEQKFKSRLTMATLHTRRGGVRAMGMGMSSDSTFQRLGGRMPRMPLSRGAEVLGGSTHTCDNTFLRAAYGQKTLASGWKTARDRLVPAPNIAPGEQQVQKLGLHSDIVNKSEGSHSQQI